MRETFHFFPTNLIFFSLFVATLLLCSEAKIKLPANITVPAFIVFGDSIVDQGNNNNLTSLIKCNFPPYGKDFQGGIPTGRFSNSRTPADFIASEVGIKEILPAYLDPSTKDADLPTGVSFASGGTGFDPQTPQLVSVIPLSTQLEYFKEYIGKLKRIVGEKQTNYILTNSLFLVVAGNDDIANTYFTIGIRRYEYDINAYSDLVASYASNFVKEIYNLGARRIGVFGVAPLGCVPSQRTLGGGGLRLCAEDINAASQLYNFKLSAQLQSLGSTLPQSKVVYIDIYNPLYDIIQYPKKYGFEVVDGGCCGTGEIEAAFSCNIYSPTCDNNSKFLFWDSFHPTEKGYKILVDQVLNKYITNFLIVVPQVTVSVVDSAHGYIKILKGSDACDFESRSSLGLQVVDRGCCGSGNLEVAVLCNKYSSTCSDDSKYLFWDSYHPTEQGYKVLTDQILTKYIDSFF